MADEVEKFVLQYNVELKDSIQKLNDLHAKMEDANKKSKEAPAAIGKGFREALGHADNLVPGIGKATEQALKFGGAIKSWSPQILVATSALAGMAYVIKQMNALRKEYNEQRQTAWDVGMSPIGVEQTQRQLITASQGRLTPAESRGLMADVQSRLQEAYTDPNPANQTALKLQMAGTSAYGQNGQIKDVTTALDEIGNKMRHVSAEQANAIGQTLGLTQNETMALRERNEAVIESTKLSQAEVARRVQSNAAMESLNASFGTIDEAMRETGNTIAEEFMPVFARVMSTIADWLSGLPGNVDKAITAFQVFNKTFELFMDDIQNPKKVLTGNVSWDKDQATATEIIAKQNAAAQTAADKQALAAQTQKETAVNNEKAIKLFSQSVSSMAGVVDEQQAWAAWAGSVGKAGGLKGMGEGAAGAAQDSGGGNGFQYGGYTSPAPTEGASTAYNVANIRSTSGGFRKFNNWEEGMAAQANQLMRYFNGKTTGTKLQTIGQIIPTWAPSSENDTSAYMKFMEQKMGAGANQKLDFDNPEILAKFMQAQAMFEKGAKNLGDLTGKSFYDAALQNKEGRAPTATPSRQTYNTSHNISQDNRQVTGDTTNVHNDQTDNSSSVQNYAENTSNVTDNSQQNYDQKTSNVTNNHNQQNNTSNVSNQTTNQQSTNSTHIENENNNSEYHQSVPMSSVYDSTDEGQNSNVHAGSRANLRLAEVFASVANLIGGGMTVGQMRNGGAMRSDIKWGLDKDEYQTTREISTLKMQLSAPQLLKNRAEYENNLLRAEQHLQALRTNYNTVLATGRGDANGARSITIQRPVYYITVQGQPNPMQTAQAVKQSLDEHSQTLVNQSNSAVSH